MRGEEGTKGREEARLRHALHCGGPEWTVQDLLSAFDPDLRSWTWWDVTRAGGNLVQVWADAMWEDTFDCEGLRWACYLSGAHSMVGPILEPAEVWARQPSLGLGDGGAAR